MKGWVYFARFGRKGPIKIGRSRDPKRRIRDLSASLPAALNLLAVMFCEDAFLEEAELHQRLAKRRVKGEWFEAAAVEEEMRHLAERLLLPDQFQLYFRSSKKARKARESSKYNGRIDLRLSRAEFRRWRETAHAENLTLSDWIRGLCNERANDPRIEKLVQEMRRLHGDIDG